MRLSQLCTCLLTTRADGTVGAHAAASRIPTRRSSRAGQTAGMAIRYGVQADSEEECAEGLAQLVDAGMVPVMLPKLLTDNRWMARAVPAPTHAPASAVINRSAQ
jgi:hypothetical protein